MRNVDFNNIDELKEFIHQTVSNLPLNEMNDKSLGFIIQNILPRLNDMQTAINNLQSKEKTIPTHLTRRMFEFKLNERIIKNTSFDFSENSLKEIKELLRKEFYVSDIKLIENELIIVCYKVKLLDSIYLYVSKIGGLKKWDEHYDKTIFGIINFPKRTDDFRRILTQTVGEMTLILIESVFQHYLKQNENIIEKKSSYVERKIQ